MEGYNFRLKLNGKDVLGVTQDTLTIAALSKDSITKDDNGVTRSKVTGHDITFRVAGLITVDADTENATDLKRDDLVEQALKTGNDAKIPFVYNCTGATSYSGTAIMTNYSEDTPASGEDDSTFTIDLKVSGAMSVVSSASNSQQ